mmetsp:Transcript_91855/g.230838  ORF Transcript_91855/g.230838 Transcript_91855/m.230838 type:complete len:293 (+) Transcript_91855:987-1865(+)
MSNCSTILFPPSPPTTATLCPCGTALRSNLAVASSATFGAPFAASLSSTEASIARMAPALPATACATRRLTPCCAKRIVAAVVLLETTPRTTARADVKAESSSWRTCERWSQVVAFSWHILESLLAYSLLSSKSAETVDNCWLRVESSSIACAFAFLAVSISPSALLIKPFLLCKSKSCNLTASVSASSTSTFLALKSVSNFSRVVMMSSEWKVYTSSGTSFSGSSFCKKAAGIRPATASLSRPRTSARAAAMRTVFVTDLIWVKLGFEAFSALMALSRPCSAAVRSASLAS